MIHWKQTNGIQWLLSHAVFSVPFAFYVQNAMANRRKKVERAFVENRIRFNWILKKQWNFNSISPYNWNGLSIATERAIRFMWKLLNLSHDCTIFSYLNWSIYVCNALVFSIQSRLRHYYGFVAVPFEFPLQSNKVRGYWLWQIGRISWKGKLQS